MFRGRWLGQLVRTRKNLAVLPVRLALATIFIAHGGEKLLEWFSEPGISPTISFYRDVLGIPIFWILMGALTEFLGGAAILLGFFVRLAAFSLSADMLVGLFKVHLPNGFFINWSLAPNVGHGIEMNIAVLGLTLCLFLEGGGSLSIDRQLTVSRQLDSEGSTTVPRAENPVSAPREVGAGKTRTATPRNGQAERSK